jgi:hypothetical protein
MAKQSFQRFVKRARKDPYFLGASLAACQESRGWSDQQLAEFLGCSEADLEKLAACRAPSRSAFRVEVHTIAKYGHCDARKLGELVKEPSIAAALRASGQKSAGSYLMAARDRKPGSRTRDDKKHGQGDDES